MEMPRVGMAAPVTSLAAIGVVRPGTETVNEEIRIVRVGRELVKESTWQGPFNGDTHLFISVKPLARLLPVSPNSRQHSVA